MILLQCLDSDDLAAAYASLSRTEYSWEELEARPLPPGVDPSRIETYLSDSVFKVSKSSIFQQLTIDFVKNNNNNGNLLRFYLFFFSDF